MSTATGRGRLFFQAVGDPTGPSQLAPKTQNPHIESSLTENLGLASSKVFGYIVPLDKVYQRPLSPGSARP